MKISISIYYVLIILINLYTIVFGELIFKACSKNGWKCTKNLNNPDKYDIEYNCGNRNNSRAGIFLWNFNAPDNIFGLKITNCEYLELDLSCSVDSQQIENVVIYNINTLNITSSIHPDLSICPPALTLDQIKKIPSLPRLKQHISFPENLYNCNKNLSNITSLIIKNVDNIEVIDSFSINLHDMDTFIIDNVSITYIKPYAINVSMIDYKDIVFNDCYIERIDVKGINFESNSFVLNNSVILNIETNGVCGKSYSFYAQECLIGIVKPNALSLVVKNAVFTKNTFGQLLPQAFYGILPDIPKDSVSNEKFIYNYVFTENNIHEANIGSLNPSLDMFENGQFNFTKNFLPCSCEELGWLHLKSGIGNGLSSVIAFSQKIMELKSENFCVDSPCSLPLSVITLMKFTNGICDPIYDLEFICNTYKYKNIKKSVRVSKKKSLEDNNENILSENSILLRKSMDDLNNAYSGNSELNSKTYMKQNRKKRYLRRKYDDNQNFLVRKIRNDKIPRKSISKKYQRRKQLKSRASLEVKAEKSQVSTRLKKITSIPDINLLDEIHLEDGTNHESFEDENEANLLKDPPKKMIQKKQKPQPKSKRYTKTISESPNKMTKLKPSIQRKIHLKQFAHRKNASIPDIDSIPSNTNEETKHESEEFGNFPETDSQKQESGEKFSIFDEKLDKPDTEDKINRDIEIDNRLDSKKDQINREMHDKNNRAILDNFNRERENNTITGIENSPSHEIEHNPSREIENSQSITVEDSPSQGIEIIRSPGVEDTHRRGIEDTVSRGTDDSLSHGIEDMLGNTNDDIPSHGSEDNPSHGSEDNPSHGTENHHNHKTENHHNHKIKDKPNHEQEHFYEARDTSAELKEEHHENEDNINYVKTETNKNQNFIRKLMDLKSLLEINNINSNQKKNMLRTIKNKFSAQSERSQNEMNPTNDKTSSYSINLDSPNTDTIEFEISEPKSKEIPSTYVAKDPSQVISVNKRKFSTVKSTDKLLKKDLPTRIIWLLNTNKYKWNKNQPIVLLPKIIAIPDSQENDNEIGQDANEEINPFLILKPLKHKNVRKPGKRNLTSLIPSLKKSKTGDVYVQDTKQMFRGEEINLEKYLSTIYGNNSKTLSSKYKYKKFLPITDAKKVLYQVNQNN